MQTLFDANKHEAAAQAWIEANPKAFELFEKFALEAARKGRRFGVGQLTERVRWESCVSISRTDRFRVNNNHRSYIARALIQKHPFLKDYIELRELRACA